MGLFIEATGNMRRQDVQLLALARQGDHDALCEVGQRYLLATQGFSKYIDLGLKYLTHPALATSERAVKIIAEALPLDELVRRDLHIALRSAAHAGSHIACLKLGVWRILTRKEEVSAKRLWTQARVLGCQSAAQALDALENDKEKPATEALSALVGVAGIEVCSTTALALSQTTKTKDFELMARLLHIATSPHLEITPELSDAVCEALMTLQANQVALPDIDNTKLNVMLEDCVRRRNPAAALLLGRAMCGIDTAFAPSTSLAPKRNLRGGTALLLRAADSGLSEAWLLLYRVHADGHGSVANPHAAIFFLEKAADSGNANAQRQLGSMILKSALDIAEFELGMHWMAQAANQDDAVAKSLLQTFVLPVQGSDLEADSVIGRVARLDPWSAHRLRISRDFGLTMSEAICVDVASGMRSWGLVISSDAADHRLRSKFCRAIPALDSKALENLRESADYFRHSGESVVQSNTERRQRGRKLRQTLDRLGVDESLFFAQVPTATIASLRQGASWAHGVRQTLRAAMTI